MDKIYTIKEIYYTIQGEGHHAGTPAVFCRFSGCNLWSGREEDRHKAICTFCDTNFWGTDGVNGGKYSAAKLTEIFVNMMPDKEHRFVVLTGGEPGLQVDDNLISHLRKHNIYISIETNGTIALPNSIDWVTFSPKANSDYILKHADEIKIVYPQQGLDPHTFECNQYSHFYIQPMEDDQWQQHTKSAIEFCKANPKWKLSVQTHKYLNIP